MEPSQSINCKIKMYYGQSSHANIYVFISLGCHDYFTKIYTSSRLVICFSFFTESPKMSFCYRQAEFSPSCCTGPKWCTNSISPHTVSVSSFCWFQVFYSFIFWLFQVSGCARWDLNGFICISIVAAGVLGKRSCFRGDLEGHLCFVWIKCHW